MLKQITFSVVIIHLPPHIFYINLRKCVCMSRKCILLNPPLTFNKVIRILYFMNSLPKNYLINILDLWFLFL